MGLFKKLFGKKSDNQKEESKLELLKQPTKSEIEKAQQMYTFSSIFPTKDIMERAMQMPHEEEPERITEKVVAVSPFHSEEDEKLFAECAQKSMSLTAELEWEGKRQQPNEEDIER